MKNKGIDGGIFLKGYDWPMKGIKVGEKILAIAYDWWGGVMQ